MKIPLLCLDIFLFSQFEQAVNNDQVGAEINYRNSETPLLESVLDSVTGFRTLASDWVTYGFGTTEFVNIFKAALQAHKDASLVMDFPLGPNQGQGVSASPDDKGL
ncbi:uncharacterized protein BDW43DRAFT_317390 [Aspergillus alliaceus]|uniref:uncharacterized protein n=1 Tax=Petromyces alliaceus TaxID=209559 RepID=UPI0012A69EC0|nr:uncharacterized protein BDW43DRAFT_317390 [Aspergillus alliaceus]KAB8226845.1 hypothetical protein BDW43DRAFT_317390 [Aspergillus alliaceus]